MIEVKGIRKAFGANAVLRDVDLAIADGEFFCLLGPSGCGKTTLLRVVAGLEKPDAGTVIVGGKDVGEAPPHKRGCALVFQNYALWPHLTVGENIGYGLEVIGKPKAEIRTVIDSSLRAYHLEGLEARYPHQLSGGQQQRVALARAMAVRPQALLMDEPLSNLDAALRKSLRRELLEFHRRSGGTILYVTHDQEEALALSDRLAVMMDGKIVETGRPVDLYARPRHLETAMFLGDMNVLKHGKIPAAMREAAKRAGATGAADATALCIRPENVRVHATKPGPSASDAQAFDPHALLEGSVAFSEFMGTHATLGVDTAAGRILSRARLSDAAGLAKGQPLFLEFPPEHCLWY
jgi:ABC-type Fe3+/spermidine/putrescine transport system ATPase subunit